MLQHVREEGGVCSVLCVGSLPGQCISHIKYATSRLYMAIWVYIHYTTTSVLFFFILFCIFKINIMVKEEQLE